MCVAIPGIVVALNEDTAEVDFSGNHVNAAVGLVNVKIGDYVLVHAGCIIQIMQKKEAEELKELVQEVGAYQ